MPKARSMREQSTQVNPFSLPVEEDDLPAVIKPENVSRGEVLLGTYGLGEWITSDFIRSRHLKGDSTLFKEDDWSAPAGFSLHEWVIKNFKDYTFLSTSTVWVNVKSETCQGAIKLYASRDNLNVEYIGSSKFVEETRKFFANNFEPTRSMIEWVYDPSGRSIDIPMQPQKKLPAAYPWLRQDLDSYIDSYLNSSASILILIGPPGTGKSTFIKHMIERSKANAKVAFDEKVIANDHFFAGFISDEDTRFLVMEDADSFLASRADGNSMMHKFLNVADGLVSAKDKKLVFSTNLPSISDIDTALIRPGRCFDILEHRALSINEAKALIDQAGAGSIPEGVNSVTLAEIFATQQHKDMVSKRKMGFV